MSFKNIYYPESRFGGFTDIDGTIAFYIRVNSLINSSSTVLDIGCGRGAYAEDPILVRRELRLFKGRCGEIIGLDVDKAAESNPFLDRFCLIESNLWLLEDDSVDICICDCVVEHLEEPDLFFSECQRVIRPGGYLCIRTANVLSYFGLFSMLIPNKSHAAVLSKVQDERKEEDVFPTLYKCNTTRRIKYMLNKYGFDDCVYGYEAEPSYLSFSRFFYLLGVIHQRFIPNLFKVAIFAFGKKQA